MPRPQNIEYLIIHITASPYGNSEVVRRWHTDPPPVGRGWLDIGYHYILLNSFPTYESWVNKRPDLATDGIVETGRDLDHDGDIDEEIGAHALGFNSKSLGIAMVGENGNFTSEQLESCLDLCSDLMDTYNVPVEKVIGHYETGNTSKPCPQIAMPYFRGLLRDWTG